MPDLEHKFEALETQLGTQHTEIMNALDTIAMALGAPPPGPTTTLADIATMLSSLNDSLSGILSANASFYSSNLEVLGLINTNLDTMLNNNSLNAQRLIAAILSTACPCATTAPLMPLPVDVTPTTLADQDKCKRIQFYLHVFTSWLQKIANYGGAGAFITGDVIGTLLGIAATEAGIVATGAEVGVAAGPPGAIIGAIIGLIIGAVGILGASILSDYATQFAAGPIQAALLAALYAENNASAGNAAFYSVVGANFSTIPAGIINALWWSQWGNDIYSGVPVVDLTGYDGSICAPDTGCITINSTVVSFASDGNGSAIVWPSPFVALNHTPAGYTADHTVWLQDDLYGYTITPTVNINFFSDWNSGSTVLPAGVAYLVVSHTSWASIHTYPSTAPFSIELCRPS